MKRAKYINMADRATVLLAGWIAEAYTARAIAWALLDEAEVARLDSRIEAMTAAQRRCTARSRRAA